MRTLFRMCKQTKYKSSNPQIDKCMREEIKEFKRALKLLKSYLDGELTIVACCCGHGKYPKSIVLRQMVEGDDEAMYFEHFSQIAIPRTRNFYKRDKTGHYYIPETTHKIKSHRLMKGVTVSY